MRRSFTSLIFLSVLIVTLFLLNSPKTYRELEVNEPTKLVNQKKL